MWKIWVDPIQLATQLTRLVFNLVKMTCFFYLNQFSTWTLPDPTCLFTTYTSSWPNNLSYSRTTTNYTSIFTTTYSWCDGHSISISACRVWRVKAEVQVFKREIYTHIHLDYARVEFYLVLKKIITHQFSQLFNMIDCNWLLIIFTWTYHIFFSTHS